MWPDCTIANRRTLDGRLRKKRVSTRMLRKWWEERYGPLPEVSNPRSEQVFMHLCDELRCDNFDHIVVATQRDNLLDMVSKGRHAKAPLKAGSVRRIRELTFTYRWPQWLIAHLFEVDDSTVRRITYGQTWAKVR